MKRLLLFIAVLSWGTGVFAQDSRDDSLIVDKYDIYIDFWDKISYRLHGSTRIDMRTKTNVQKIVLDLKTLLTDSVKIDQRRCSYIVRNDKVYITLDTAVGPNTNLFVNVYYHGYGFTDASFGGFYYRQPYCFNLGVAFNSIPHNFGKAWFPCIDNFTQRSRFTIRLHTYGNDVGMSNGKLVAIQGTPGVEQTYVWEMKDPIPTYLASFAVAPYAIVNQEINGHQVMLAALPNDTVTIKSSFLHLPEAVTTYEKYYGPYVWDKIGYSVVSFNGGAMEHATNIAYPKFAVDGTLQYETLFAHELSHHWWGNLLTCDRAEEMWLNEGWAVFSEFLFTEALYGRDAYREAVKSKIHTAMLNVPWKEPHTALNQVSQQYTYGIHSYPKGGAIAHTLRTYMGDSAFFDAIRDMYSQHKFQNFNSDSLKTWFEKASNTDLTGFFNDWVKQPGSPHFRIRYPETGPDFFEFTVEQSLRGALHHFQHVPLDILLMDAAGHRITRSLKVSGHQTKIRLEQLPFQPVAWCLDPEDKLADAAITDIFPLKEVKVYSSTGNIARLTLSSSPADTIRFLLQHNWISGGNMVKEPGLFIVPSRYWTINGNFNNGDINGTLRLEYDGGSSSSGLDGNLISFPESALRLLWRPNEETPWQEASDVSYSIGNGADGRGFAQLSKINKGDYAFGAYAPILHTGPESGAPVSLVYPNPGKESWNLSRVKAGSNYEVYDLQGKLLLKGRQEADGVLTVPYEHWNGKHFLLLIHPENEAVQTYRLVLEP